MPRKHPLAQPEREIGRRIKQVRQAANYPRSFLAFRTGTGHSVITFMELGRTAVKYEFARKFCAEFNINPVWLATGRGRVSPSVSLPTAQDLEERENARFYEVYLNKLASLLESNAKAGAEGDLPQVGPSNFESRRQKLADILFADLTEKMEGIRSDVLDAFVLAVKKSAGGLVQPGWKDTWENILRRRQLRVSEARDQKFQNPISEELNLTNAAISDKGDGVKSEWLKLKKKIQAVTANAGSKSKLADFLCVDLTQLSKWLTDSDSAREPGADYTLRMQAWVNDPKRQK